MEKYIKAMDAIFWRCNYCLTAHKKRVSRIELGKLFDAVIDVSIFDANITIEDFGRLQKYAFDLLNRYSV